VEFEPVSVGNITGSIVLTDNSLNAASPYATQTISLAGTAIAAVNMGSLTIAPMTQTFASTPVGSTSSSLTSTITNTTNQAIYLSSGSLTDATDFTQTSNCAIISANGGTCTVTFTFTPQTSGALTSTYSIHDLNHPGSPLTVVLSGNGTAVASVPQATLSPATADYGNVTIGTASSAQTFTLSNTGSAALGITSISLSGANPDSFLIVNDTCATGTVADARPAHSQAATRGRANPHDFPGLPSAGTCQILVVFSSTGAGSSAATLTIVDQAGAQTSTLTGIGVASAPAPAPQAALTAASANFNSLAAGSISAAQTFTLANAGNAVLSINSVALTGANASSFQLGADTCGTTLAAGGSCTIAVTFDPATTGSFTASLSVTDAVGTQTSALSGTGVVFSTPADFTIAATPAVQSSYRGATVSYAVQLTSADPNNPFTSTVALTAVGLPEGTSVSFSPGSVVPGTTQAASSTMTVTIPAVSGRNSPPISPFPLNSVPVAVSLASLGFMWFSRSRWKQRPRLMILLAFAILAGATALTGCSGTKTGFAVPTSTTIITVTGTSGSITHSSAVMLTIQ
jgi:trimeric autotransporter adhesin